MLQYTLSIFIKLINSLTNKYAYSRINLDSLDNGMFHLVKPSDNGNCIFFCVSIYS